MYREGEGLVGGGGGGGGWGKGGVGEGWVGGGWGLQGGDDVEGPSSVFGPYTGPDRSHPNSLRIPGGARFLHIAT